MDISDIIILKIKKIKPLTSTDFKLAYYFEIEATKKVKNYFINWKINELKTFILDDKIKYYLIKNGRIIQLKKGSIIIGCSEFVDVSREIKIKNIMKDVD